MIRSIFLALLVVVVGLVGYSTVKTILDVEAADTSTQDSTTGLRLLLAGSVLLLLALLFWRKVYILSKEKGEGCGPFMKALLCSLLGFSILVTSLTILTPDIGFGIVAVMFGAFPVVFALAVFKVYFWDKRHEEKEVK